jgi:tRNA-splicing ligase RtcB
VQGDERRPAQQKLRAVFGDPVDTKALEQLTVVLDDDRAVAGALMADHHVGYSMPIGGVVAYENAISPSGVGFDIACGNKAVRTDALVDDLGEITPWMRLIEKRISFGLGRVRSGSDEHDFDHPLFDDPLWSELDTEPGQPLKQKASMQLGTVGSGNHYVDLLRDDDGYLWVANHFGSRGLGHAIATMGLTWAYGDGPVQRDEPAVLELDTEQGQLYLAAMGLAGEYAYAGRDYVVDQVLSLLGNPSVTLEVHNHHNFAWLEDGLWVVRKGATPLTLDPAFIGGSMGDVSVIVRGKPAAPGDGVEDVGAIASAPHGAGRVMSRTAAAGKLRRMWHCRNRNCGFVPVRASGNAAPFEGGKCPECGLPLSRSRMRDTSDAAVDWDTTRRDLAERGIVVLGSGADEAPQVYKDLATVLACHANIEILHTLDPVGVVMAGSDVHDPYKD